MTMGPEDVKVGDYVMYSVSLDGPHFRARVASEPWHLGEHTWVCRLDELPNEYREYTRTNRHAVPCAALFALVPCDRAESTPDELSAVIDHLRKHIETISGGLRSAQSNYAICSQRLADLRTAAERVVSQWDPMNLNADQMALIDLIETQKTDR